MLQQLRPLAMTGLLIVLAGCAHDRPHRYGQERPPVDEVDTRDRGIQSLDVLSASDKMAASLLSLRELNESKVQWTIVIDKVEDQTTDKVLNTNYQIFLDRLKINLSKQGHGRVQLIENRDKFYKLRSNELETGRDDFGQGAPGQPAAPQSIQPDFSLYMKAADLPNRGTTYYLLSFVLTDLHNRTLVWADDYEVKTAR